MAMQEETRLVPTPQATHIYALIGDLMEEARRRYDNAPKSSRNLTIQNLWLELAKMNGDYCMAFTERGVDAKIGYLGRLRSRYYIVEGMFNDMMRAKVITVGHLANLSKTKLTPLIKEINGLIKRTKQGK